MRHNVEHVGLDGGDDLVRDLRRGLAMREAGDYFAATATGNMLRGDRSGGGKEFGGDGAGAKHGDADIMVGKLHAQGFRKADNGEFGGGIGRELWRGEQALDRGGVDDVAGQAEFAQAVRGELAPVEGAGKVDVEHKLPGFGRDFERRGEGKGDTRDVAEELDRAKLGFCTREQGGPGGPVSRVQRGGDVGGVPEGGGGFSETFGVDIGDDEAHGLRGAGKRDGLADAARRASDEGGFACK